MLARAGCLAASPHQEARRHATSPYVEEWNGKCIKGALECAAKRAVKASPYVLRHTAAVWIAEAGVPIPELGQYLGPPNLGTTCPAARRVRPEWVVGSSLHHAEAYCATMLRAKQYAAFATRQAEGRIRGS
jgi:hypothetical protein